MHTVSYTVTCANGHQTHGFANHRDAADYAEWGHCCLSARSHTITKVESVEIIARRNAA